MPGSDQAEDSDWINVLNAQDIFLEGAGGIHLEFHQNHKPSLISRIIFLLRRHRDGDGSQQGFYFSPHISSVVTVTQAVRSELVFISSPQLCWLYQLDRIWGLRNHELQMVSCFSFIASGRTAQKTPLPAVLFSCDVTAIATPVFRMHWVPLMGEFFSLTNVMSQNHSQISLRQRQCRRQLSFLMNGQCLKETGRRVW
jgi:hypothetical protein